MSSRRRDWCRHYRAMSGNDTCKAGVNWEEAFGGRLGILNRLPCFGEPDRMHCDQQADWTPEEIETQEREMLASFDRMAKAMAAIKEHAAGRKGIGGRIPCPCCGRQLAFSIASVNGHVHAQCETAHCVSFLQ